MRRRLRHALNIDQITVIYLRTSFTRMIGQFFRNAISSFQIPTRTRCPKIANTPILTVITQNTCSIYLSPQWVCRCLATSVVVDHTQQHLLHVRVARGRAERCQPSSVVLNLPLRPISVAAYPQQPDRAYVIAAHEVPAVPTSRFRRSTQLLSFSTIWKPVNGYCYGNVVTIAAVVKHRYFWVAQKAHT